MLGMEWSGTQRELNKEDKRVPWLFKEDQLKRICEKLQVVGILWRVQNH